MGGLVEVKLDLDWLRANCDAAQEALVQEVLSDCTPNVPKDTGALQNSGHPTGKTEITWDEEYADYVYSGTSKMDARPWFENTKSQKLDHWKDVVEEVITARG